MTVKGVHFIGYLLGMVLGMGVALGEPLAEVEARQVERYTQSLLAGGGYHAETEGHLADANWQSLLVVMEAMAAADPELPLESRLALESLLERMSRGAVRPWRMIRLYSPELAALLIDEPAPDTLASRLFQGLRRAGTSRSTWDLAVRLTPSHALMWLRKADNAHRVELLNAWNRRLRAAQEGRPLPEMEAHLSAIADGFKAELPEAERVALLRFMAWWPQLESAYERALRQCLAHADAEIVTSALQVQGEHPALLSLNRELLTRFPDDAELRESAIRAYLADGANDHSATLRAIWESLPQDEVRLRYTCLQSMLAHPAGNGEIALTAVRASPLEYADVALGVLQQQEDTAAAEAAVRSIFEAGTAGKEPALRLARSLELTQFTDEAVDILQRSPDQIVRQAAMAYLRLADSATKRKLLPWLSHQNDDLRLAAIQIYNPARPLTPEHYDIIGPALTRIVLRDPSPGHRQEALFVLAGWRHGQTRPLFAKVLADNPPLSAEEHLTLTDAQYWQYRMRLIALLGLAALGDDSARDALIALHQHGNLTQSMDVLLAFSELGSVPEIAFEDLRQVEPKLVATATRLIATHGTPEQIERLHHFFHERPLWELFERSGIDDHSIRHLAGLEDGHGHHHH